MSKSCSAAVIVSQFVVDDALLEDETNVSSVKRGTTPETTEI